MVYNEGHKKGHKAILDETYSFGYWVRRRRKALDLSQRELAERASCSLSAVKKIERDTRRPSLELAEILADCLAIPETERESFLLSARGLAPVDKLPLDDQPLPTAEPSEEPQGVPVPEVAPEATSKPKGLMRRSWWLVLAAGLILILVIVFIAFRDVEPFPSLISDSVPGSSSDIVYGADNPEALLRAIVEAAQTGNFIPLYGLCDPLAKHDENAAHICAMATTRENRQLFRRVFAESEVVGEIVYSPDGLEAELTFSHGSDSGVIKTVTLVQRDGRWYLLTWPPLPDNRD